MTEKVAYILGAGFSAPLGLPVMSNFLIKSKDLYFSNPEQYKHFRSVFDAINELSVSKNYYSADLFNIEEILSIIEMGTFLEGRRLKKVFIQYILDVIKFYTPMIEPYPNQLPGNWQDVMFGKRGIIQDFGYFAINLFGSKARPARRSESGDIINELHFKRISPRSTRYAVITLNYDLVLENYYKFINDQYHVNQEMKFNIQEAPADWDYPPLAKLHGSLDSGLIVPPTWTKGNNPKITPIWEHAYQILREANHIRFIGYSLPIADSYIKFLLKSAVVKAEHLKSIDVICQDKDGAVKKRFDEFIEFDYYRFANASVEEYVSMLSKRYTGVASQSEFVRFNDLEAVHYNFMVKHDKSLTN